MESRVEARRARPRSAPGSRGTWPEPDPPTPARAAERLLPPRSARRAAALPHPGRGGADGPRRGSGASLRRLVESGGQWGRDELARTNHRPGVGLASGSFGQKAVCWGVAAGGAEHVPRRGGRPSASRGAPRAARRRPRPSPVESSSARRAPGEEQLGGMSPALKEHAPSGNAQPGPGCGASPLGRRTASRWGGARLPLTRRPRSRGRTGGAGRLGVHVSPRFLPRRHSLFLLTCTLSSHCTSSSPRAPLAPPGTPQRTAFRAPRRACNV